MSEAIAVPAEGVAELAPSAVVAARTLSRQYGQGDTAVQAPRRRSRRPARSSRPSRAVRLWQVDAEALARGACRARRNLR